MMRLQSDLPELCLAAINGTLDQVQAQWDSRSAIGVVLAAGGYPDNYSKGHIISGLDSNDSEAARIFHAGTSMDNDNVVTSGGRVLCVCALADSVQAAASAAYAGCGQIHWDGVFYRRDIGYRAIAREQA